MNILAIETSCDETAVAILKCSGDEKSAKFRILGNTLISQIDVHQEYGGVFPALAKREHAKNLVPLLLATLEEAQLLVEDTQALSPSVHEEITTLLAREPGLTELFLEAISHMETPAIDAIAVTNGPGLAPALWVGVNFAKALSVAWDKPLVGVNHMEGHLLAALAKEDLADKNVQRADEGKENTLVIQNLKSPLLALLISGGHTELVLMKNWLEYQLVGATRDDAVGEAYDKVARMLGLPYPGGPEISRLADSARKRHGEHGSKNPFTLPRPMIHESHYDFSFSGLKTSVLYLVRDLKNERGENADLTQTEREEISLAFEDACAEVLVSKTIRALEKTGARTLAIGGGVSANNNIKEEFKKALEKEGSGITLRIPAPTLSGDNAVMIGLAGYYRALQAQYIKPDDLLADGNLSLAK
jgi:N6-L-threonylcarbamoyladenine synthase